MEKKNEEKIKVKYRCRNVVLTKEYVKREFYVCKDGWNFKLEKSLVD